MAETINDQIAEAKKRIKHLQQLKLKNRYRGKYLILANVFGEGEDNNNSKRTYKIRYMYYLNPFLIMRKLCKSKEVRKEVQRYAKETDNTDNLYILDECLKHNTKIKQTFISDKNIDFAQLHFHNAYFQVSLHDLKFKPYTYEDILFDKGDVKSLVNATSDKVQRRLLENGVVSIDNTDKAKVNIIKLILKQRKERQLY